MGLLMTVVGGELQILLCIEFESQISSILLQVDISVNVPKSRELLQVLVELPDDFHEGDFSVVNVREKLSPLATEFYERTR